MTFGCPKTLKAKENESDYRENAHPSSFKKTPIHY